MERTNMWAKRAHLRDTRDSGDMKSEILMLLSNISSSRVALFTSRQAASAF